jgi:hypothetical protein
VEEDERVREEDRADHDREPCEVALDDVRPSLRCRGEAQAAEAGVSPRVHEHERDEHCGEQDLQDGRGLKEESEDEHGARVAASSRYLPRVSEDARARIQKLLVTGDNRLKQGVSAEKVRETYEEALAVARGAGIEESVRRLVEVRLADLERLRTRAE